MFFEMSERSQEILDHVRSFMDAHIFPAEDRIFEQLEEGDRWQIPPLVEELKVKARGEGLWNLF